jgi:hypothetical protein
LLTIWLRNIAQEIVSAALRLREQLSREQLAGDRAASHLALRAYAEELISKKLRFAPPSSNLRPIRPRPTPAGLWSSPDPPARAKPPR